MPLYSDQYLFLNVFVPIRPIKKNCRNFEVVDFDVIFGYITEMSQNRNLLLQNSTTGKDWNEKRRCVWWCCFIVLKIFSKLVCVTSLVFASCYKIVKREQMISTRYVVKDLIFFPCFSILMPFIIYKINPTKLYVKSNFEMMKRLNWLTKKKSLALNIHVSHTHNISFAIDEKCANSVFSIETQIPYNVVLFGWFAMNIFYV